MHRLNSPPVTRASRQGSQPRRAKLSRRAGSIAATLALAATLTAIGGYSSPVDAAVCPTNTWVDNTEFEYVRCNIPDVDQRRRGDVPGIPGLPGNGGMYCAPTSAMNFMAYLANQGFPSVNPGPGSWEAQPPPPGQLVDARYNEMTGWLESMGNAMATDPVDGTGGGGLEAGVKAWLDVSGVGPLFTVSSYWQTVNRQQLFWRMALAAHDGALVMPVVGFYKTFGELKPEMQDLVHAKHGDNIDDEDLFRDGGHVMSLALARAPGDIGKEGVLGVRDPASPNDGAAGQYFQSSFSTDEHDIVSEIGWFDGTPGIQSRIDGPNIRVLLDSYFTIKPKSGVITDKANVTFVRPIRLSGDDTPPTVAIANYASADGRTVSDFAMSPQGTMHPYITDRSNVIWQVNAVTGRSARFATVNKPKRLVFGGREQNLYVLLPSHLISLGLDGRQVDRVRLPAALDSIGYDTFRDEVVGISEDRRSVLRFDAALNHVGTLDIPELPREGRITIRSDPSKGAMWIHSDGSPRVLRFSPDARADVQIVALQGAESPIGMGIDDYGHLFLSDGDVLTEYDPLGRRAAGSPFDGLPGGSTVDISRSFSNFNAETMSDAQYRNVLPEDAFDLDPNERANSDSPFVGSWAGTAFASDGNQVSVSATLTQEPRGEVSGTANWGGQLFALSGTESSKALHVEGGAEDGSHLTLDLSFSTSEGGRHLDGFYEIRALDGARFDTGALTLTPSSSAGKDA